MLKLTLSFVVCFITITTQFSNGFPTGTDDYRFIDDVSIRSELYSIYFQFFFSMPVLEPTN